MMREPSMVRGREEVNSVVPPLPKSLWRDEACRLDTVADPVPQLREQAASFAEAMRAHTGDAEGRGAACGWHTVFSFGRECETTLSL